MSETGQEKKEGFVVLDNQSWADASENADQPDQEEPISATKPKNVWGTVPVQHVDTFDIAKAQEEHDKSKVEAKKKGIHKKPGPSTVHNNRNDSSDTYGSHNEGGGGRPPRRDYGENRYNDYSGGSGGGGGSGSGSGGGGDYGSGGYRNRKEESSESQPRPPRQPLPDSAPYTAFVGNLNFQVTEDDLAEYYEDLGIKEIRIVREQPGGRSKGFGYVEFTTRDGLEKALMSDNTPFKGRNLNVDVEKNRLGANGRQKREWGPSKDGENRSFGRDSYGGGRDSFGGGRDSFGGGRDSFGGGRDSYGGGRTGGGGGGRAGRSFGPSQFKSDSPAERPKINIKPKSEKPENLTSSSEKPKLSEDPFGGAADDLQKLDLQQKKMLERQQEIERSKEEKFQKDKEKDKDKDKEDKTKPVKPFSNEGSWRSKNSNTPTSSRGPNRGGGSFRGGDKDYGRGDHHGDHRGGQRRGGDHQTGGEFREQRGGEFREQKGGEFREQRGGEFREQREHRAPGPRRQGAPDSYNLPGAGRGRKSETSDQSHQKAKGKELPQGNRFDLLRSDGGEGADDNENDNEESSK